MTKKQVFITAFATAILVFAVYLHLLNIDLTSDAQAGIAYFFHGPPGLIPSFFAFAFVQTFAKIWQNRARIGTILPTVFLCIVCAVLVIAPLIYTYLRFSS